MTALAVTFLFPAVLWAATAAAAPVIIHLIMRTKPRKIVFPAMRFVRKTHQANISKLRLKHLILLAMRIAALLLIVALLARAQIPRWHSSPAAGAPAAAVVVMDTSGSMNYLLGGVSSLARGQKLAAEIVQMLPTGSAVAIVASSNPASTMACFLSDRKLAIEQINSCSAGAGSDRLAPAIGKALALLETSDLRRKEVFVVTDMTAQAWQDMATVAAEGVNFTVLNCSAGENNNFWLGEAELTASHIPLGAAVGVSTLVRAGDMGGPVAVITELNGQPISQQTVNLAANGSASVEMSIAPPREGVAHGRLVLRQLDPMELDNVRHFTINVGRPMRVLIVRDPTTVGRDDPVSRYMSVAVSPPEEGGKAVLAKRIVSADRLDNKSLEETDVLILADVASLSDAQWEGLHAFARGGGCVWAVAGTLMSPAAYNTPAAQAVFPVSLKSPQIASTPLRWDAGRLEGALLEPFRANPSLAEVKLFYRLAVESTATNAAVELKYADAVPAIVSRPIGNGLSIFWNFSPAPALSDLAQHAQGVILALRTMHLLAQQAGRQSMFHIGQQATVSLPKTMRAPMARLRRPGQQGERPLATDMAKSLVSIPCDQLGHWTVDFAEADLNESAGFSVNAPAAESDLSAADEQALGELFPSGRLAIVSSPADLVAGQGKVRHPLDLTAPLLLALLLLITGESFFANRFYRRGDTALKSQPQALQPKEETGN